MSNPDLHRPIGTQLSRCGLKWDLARRNKKYWTPLAKRGNREPPTPGSAKIVDTPVSVTMFPPLDHPPESTLRDALVRGPLLFSMS